MKKIIITVLHILIFSILLTSCVEAKRPNDYPSSDWYCEAENMKFSVNADGEIVDATMVNNNGDTISVLIILTDITEGAVSITNADQSETYFFGVYTFVNDVFTIFVTDEHHPDIPLTSSRLTFERV